MKNLVFLSLFLMIYGCSSQQLVEAVQVGLVAPENDLDLKQDNTSLVIKNSGLINANDSISAFDSEELELALRNMLSRLVESTDGAKKQENGWVEGTYHIKRGDTLSAIVHDAVKGTEIRPDFILQAIVKINPSAFVRGNPNWMLAGSKLKFPKAGAFNRLFFVKSTERDIQQTENDPYLGWIKYP